MFFDERQILKHAHPVLRPVALVQALHSCTGVNGTIVTKAALCGQSFFTDRNGTSPAGIGLGLIIAVTTLTTIFLTNVTDA